MSIVKLAFSAQAIEAGRNAVPKVHMPSINVGLKAQETGLNAAMGKLEAVQNARKLGATAAGKFKSMLKPLASRL